MTFAVLLSLLIIDFSTFLQKFNSDVVTNPVFRRRQWATISNAKIPAQNWGKKGAEVAKGEAGVVLGKG